MMPAVLVTCIFFSEECNLVHKLTFEEQVLDF